MTGNLPPGVTSSDIDGPYCDQCGRHGSMCNCKDDGDLRTYRERLEDEKADTDEGR